VIVIGAGQAGLLAARRLAHHHPVIIEQQETLPNNHGALLRFRTDEIAKSLGIEFQKVMVYKGVLCEDQRTITNSPTIRDFNAYSYKTTKRIAPRSIINIEHAVRYVAPINFISNLASGTNIQYGKSLQDYFNKRVNGEPIVSTVPMPILMETLHYPFKPSFHYQPIWSINCILADTEVYQTLYVPYADDEPYRVSITGNKMTLEFAFDPNGDDCDTYDYVNWYCDLIFGRNRSFGNVTIKQQDYGKIVPIDDNERQKFILWATDKFNIYSLGRYATWRQLLLDDVMKDIALISKMILQRSDYRRHLPTEGS